MRAVKLELELERMKAAGELRPITRAYREYRLARSAEGALSKDRIGILQAGLDTLMNGDNVSAKTRASLPFGEAAELLERSTQHCRRTTFKKPPVRRPAGYALAAGRGAAQREAAITIYRQHSASLRMHA